MKNIFYKIISKDARKIISKARENERAILEEEYDKKLSQKEKEIREEYKKESDFDNARYLVKLNQQRKNHKLEKESLISFYHKELRDRDKILKDLKKEKIKNRALYQGIRDKEEELDYLSGDLETTVEQVCKKIHEIFQPIQRARAKIHYHKKKSDKEEGKIINILNTRRIE